MSALSSTCAAGRTPRRVRVAASEHSAAIVRCTASCKDGCGGRARRRYDRPERARGSMLRWRCAWRGGRVSWPLEPEVHPALYVLTAPCRAARGCSLVLRHLRVGQRRHVPSHGSRGAQRRKAHNSGRLNAARTTRVLTALRASLSALRALRSGRGPHGPRSRPSASFLPFLPPSKGATLRATASSVWLPC